MVLLVHRSPPQHPTASLAERGAKASRPLPGRGLRRSGRCHVTARCSGSPRSRLRWVAASSTAPWSSRSKAPATDCAPLPTSSPSTPARTPPSRRRRLPKASAGHPQKGSRPCLNPADRQSWKWGILNRHSWNSFGWQLHHLLRLAWIGAPLARCRMTPRIWRGAAALGGIRLWQSRICATFTSVAAPLMTTIRWRQSNWQASPSTSRRNGRTAAARTPRPARHSVGAATSRHSGERRHRRPPTPTSAIRRRFRQNRRF